MSLLHVRLFGRFDVRNGHHALPGFEARRAQELFCYLLLYRDRPHPREALANLLWDERDTDSPSRCLRKALWQLRTALNAQHPSLGERVLLVESDWIQINPGADLWLDVADFEHTFQRLRHNDGHELDPHQVRALTDAVDLFRGGLQQSWYQDWYLYERERFRDMYLGMLEKLVAHCEATHDYAAGIQYGNRILGWERAHERTHRRLMRLYYLAGDRTAALRQYQQCAAALRKELDVSPSRVTQALHDQIRTEALAGPLLEWPSVDNGLHEDDDCLPHVLHHLDHLLTALDQVKQEIYQEIGALRLTLGSQS